MQCFIRLKNGLNIDYSLSPEQWCNKLNNVLIKKLNKVLLIYTYKEAVTVKTKTTHINNIAILGDSIIIFGGGVRSESNKNFEILTEKI